VTDRTADKAASFQGDKVIDTEASLSSEGDLATDRAFKEVILA
jgi:hypothetical protein